MNIQQIKYLIYNRNTYNNENDLTKNETGIDNLKSKNNNIIIIALNKFDNTCSYSQTKKIILLSTIKLIIQSNLIEQKKNLIYLNSINMKN